VLAQVATMHGAWFRGFPHKPTLIHMCVIIFTDALSLTLAAALVQDSQTACHAHAQLHHRPTARQHAVSCV